MDLEHHTVAVNGTELHYVRKGAGPLIVFLHGFPQGWFIFQDQLEEFGRDHTVVAVDLRGFNLSAKPERLWEYGSWVMAEDIRELVLHLGFKTFTLVGHDTGGTVAYSFALHHPELLERLAILSTAHPALFDRELHSNPAQIKASQYLLAFRRRDSPALIAEGAFAWLRAIVDAHEFFDEGRKQLHIDAWGRPRAAEGMLAWYQREGLGPADQGTPARGSWIPEVSPLVIETPSLVIYGEQDAFVLPACFEGLDQYMPDLVLHEIPAASHWLLDEHPELVSRLLREFVGVAARA